MRSPRSMSGLRISGTSDVLLIPWLPSILQPVLADVDARLAVAKELAVDHQGDEQVVVVHLHRLHGPTLEPAERGRQDGDAIRRAFNGETLEGRLAGVEAASEAADEVGLARAEDVHHERVAA